MTDLLNVNPVYKAAEQTRLAKGTRAPVRSIDRLAEGTSIVVGLRGLNVPSRSELVSRVRSMIGLGSDARLGRTLVDGVWSYRPAMLDEQAESMVRPLTSSLESFRALPRLRELADGSLPIIVFAGRRDAVVCIDHRLGDGLFAVGVVEALFAGHGVPAMFTRRTTEHPLRTAMAYTFGRSPQRIASLVGQRIRARSGSPRATEHIAPEPIVSGPGIQLHLAHGEMSADMFRLLRRRTRGEGPLSSTLLVLLRRALELSGIPVAREGIAIVDLRRYLPAGKETLTNFVVGHPLDLTTDRVEIGQKFRDDLRSARPLAALAVGLTTRGWKKAPAAASTLALPIVSDMGMVRALEAVPWDAAGSGLAVSVDPGRSNGVTMLTTILGGRMNISLSYDSHSFDCARMEAVRALVCDDPLAVLR